MEKTWIIFLSFLRFVSNFQKRPFIISKNRNKAMSKSLSESLHYINYSNMAVTNLSPAYPDEAWLFSDNQSAVYSMMSNRFVSGMESKLSKPSLQIYYTNMGGAPHRFYSQLSGRNPTNPEQPTPASSPISWEDFNRRLAKNQNRINIPSVLHNFNHVQKSQSLNSEMPLWDVGKNYERFLAYKNDSQNTKSTANSIRERIKEINWPRSFRLAENCNIFNKF